MVIHVTDRPVFNKAAIVTRQRLQSIGFNVTLQRMDWSTSIAARARKDPPDKGGWNLFHTYGRRGVIESTAVSPGVVGRGSEMRARSTRVARA